MKIVITGGTGFLGKNLAFKLKDMGHEVFALGRNEKIGQELKDNSIIFINSTLENKETMQAAFTDADTVVHSAAFSSPWGKLTDFYQVNVLGTRNVMELCFENKVKKLIHISTPSVYFDFKDEFEITEQKVLKTPFASLYTETKFMAEKILDDNLNQKDLQIITLRPRGIFGPGDTTLLPRLISACQKGNLKIIGDGKNIIDLTYVDNVSYAIILCMKDLPHLHGKKINITNDEPINLWPFLTNLMDRLDLNLNQKKIPYAVAFQLAHGMEKFYKIFKKNQEPPLTRYSVGLLAKSQTLDINLAKKELGYQPTVSMEEGLNNVIQWWKNDQARI